ncbi:MAG: hypothetical protein P8H17_01995 [Flavobacteriales bacterium]|nr:hypothetical protein [Flavobacteriales bacterium]
MACGKVMTEIPIIEKRNTDILIYPKFINNKKIAKNIIESKVCGYNNLMNLSRFKSDCKDFK